MLQVQGISKNYGDLQVLDNVSLEVQKGEIVSITGASGAGKSTLLHIMGGLDIPDAGTIHIQETDIFKLNTKKQAQFRNKHLGFVFQFHHLLPEFSAKENVAIPLWIQGMSKAKGLEEAIQILEIVGLKKRVENKPSELSGGEQQRVAIARALVNKPDIVLADEPTGNLDSHNAQSVHELFLSLRAQLNQTFVMVTHNESLAKMTDRTLLMRDGRIAKEELNNYPKN